MTVKLILTALVCINILNFLDRGIIPGSTNEFNEFITDCKIDQDQDVYLGLLQSSFIIGYAISSVIFGNMVHYYAPFSICSGGLIIWIFAVILSGISFYAKSYVCLLFGRMISGVGEASFQCVVPAWISTNCPAKERSSCLAFFYTAISVGTAAGYIYSAGLSATIGWQWAFFIEAILMLPFLFFVISIIPLYPLQVTPQELTRNSKEDIVFLEDFSIDRKPNMWQEFLIVVSKPIFIIIVIGQAAQTGVLIGISTFGSAFLMGLGYFDTETESSAIFGMIVCLTGVISTPLGGIILDKMIAKRKLALIPMLLGYDHEEVDGTDVVDEYDNSYIDEMEQPTLFSKTKSELISIYSSLQEISICNLIGTTAMCSVCFIYNKELFMFFLSVGCAFIFACYAGTNQALMLAVPEDNRSFAIALSTLCQHMLGDVPSPVITGAIKSSLAPGCTPNADDDDIDSIASSDGCRNDAGGLRFTIFIVSSFLWITVISYFIGLYYVRKKYEVVFANTRSGLRLLLSNEKDDGVSTGDNLGGYIIVDVEDKDRDTKSSRYSEPSFRRGSEHDVICYHNKIYVEELIEDDLSKNDSSSERNDSREEITTSGRTSSLYSLYESFAEKIGQSSSKKIPILDLNEDEDDLDVIKAHGLDAADSSWFNEVEEMKQVDSTIRANSSGRMSKENHSLRNDNNDVADDDDIVSF